MDSETLLELTKMLLEFLQEVGSSVATQAFQITAQKVLFDGFFFLCVGIAFFFLFLLCLFWTWKASARSHTDEFGFSVFFSIVLFGITSIFLYLGLGRIFATEFYTVKLIIDLIR